MDQTPCAKSSVSGGAVHASPRARAGRVLGNGCVDGTAHRDEIKRFVFCSPLRLAEPAGLRIKMGAGRFERATLVLWGRGAKMRDEIGLLSLAINSQMLCLPSALAMRATHSGHLLDMCPDPIRPAAAAAGAFRAKPNNAADYTIHPQTSKPPAAIVPPWFGSLYPFPCPCSVTPCQKNKTLSFPDRPAKAPNPSNSVVEAKKTHSLG